MRRTTHRVWGLLLVLGGIIGFAGCSGLTSEPPIVTTLIPATSAPIESDFPASAPRLALGAQLYAANCIRCHGERGGGDGELVQSGQVQNAGNFLDPLTAVVQTPSDWFKTITNGRIENLMPPWRDALTAEERWAVALYTYTLHYTPDAITRGQELYTANCAECHGESGRGDGPKAAELSDDPGNLSDPAGMAFIADAEAAVSIHEGIGNIMPAFGIEYGGELTAEEITAIVGYMRTLAAQDSDAIGRTITELASFRNSAQNPTRAPVDPATTEEANAPITADTNATLVAPRFVRIIGQMRNGTASGTLPAAQELKLFAFDADFNQTETIATTAADGSFVFEGIPHAQGAAYIVTTNYRERVFASDLLRGEALDAAAADGLVELPLTIYELTDDPAVISISGIVTQVNIIGDGMEIAQIFNVTNTSDRAFTSSQLTEDGRPISLVMSLPPGAVVASLPNGENRFVVAPEDFSLIDTLMVLPGEEHLVNVIYLVQYGGGAIMEQPLNYALNGNVRLLIRPENIRVSGEQFASLGPQRIGNTTFASYGSTLALGADALLRYEVGGAGAEAGQIDRTSGVVSSNNLPLIVGAVLVIVGIIVVGIYFLARDTTATDQTQQTQIDALALAVVQLDGEHAAGKISSEDYQVQRAALKARMARLIAQQTTSSEPKGS